MCAYHNLIKDGYCTGALYGSEPGNRWVPYERGGKCARAAAEAIARALVVRQAMATSVAFYAAKTR